MFIVKVKEFDYDEQIACTDFNTVKIKTVQNRQKSKLSFLQLSKFIPQSPIPNPQYNPKIINKI